MVKVGQHVIYVDPVSKQSDALVTAVWSETCINIVLVNDNDTMQDSYGRQIERKTSLSNKNVVGAHGNYWMFPGEEPNPANKPLES